VEDAERLVQASQLSHIKVGLSDVDGVMLGKYLRRDKFLGALRSGLAFCDVVFGWDLDDQLYDNTKYTGWHTAYPDAKLRIIPQSGRRLPLEQGRGRHLSAAPVAPDAGPGRRYGL
jgi:glutamine synthetase